MIHETDAFTQYAYVAAAEALAMAGKKDGERSGENARMSDDPDHSAGIGGFLQIRIKWVSLWGLPWLELLRRQRRRKS